MNDLCPASAPFFGFMGAAVALIFASKPTARAPHLIDRPQPPEGPAAQRARAAVRAFPRA